MEQMRNTPPLGTPLQMARSMCWHCQSQIQGEYFCDRCVKVQPLSKELDYFTCLGLPRRLNIDTSELETAFYRLSRTFHPDFYQRKTETEQSISLGNSALLNTAYRTLKDPIRRAEYLLGLEAGSVKDIRSSPPSDLFDEILALQESLEEYRLANRTNDKNVESPLRDRLMADRDTLRKRQSEMQSRLGQLFLLWDSLAGEDPEKIEGQPHRDRVLHELRELLSNRTYLLNILNDLENTLDVQS